ncbi:MAG TPA: 2-oxo-4-hydroxy-4-carboxy-5-ureidoimidazoline decarboxylase [Gemmatimonadota bacterium]|nr:2-oxo-4-hydroxy-4-carboxy-5-ureidoimidazoline decarboxylase [Gemmatimonadota bacterium]
MSAGLERLNGASAESARAVLAEVCGAPGWAEAVAAGRPFGVPAELFGAAEAAWDDLAPAAWIAALEAHPRLGEDRRVAGGSASAWSRAEQAGVGDDSRASLARVQEEYERRFGWPFVACATGRSGAELLADCEARLAHEPDDELAVAAGEERRIGRLRLGKLLEGGME